MKETIRRGLLFVRNNSTIISSLLLIFVVVGALFLNSYLTMNRFQENLDKTLRTKAVLAENILGTTIADYFSSSSSSSNLLQTKFEEIVQKDSEIVEVSLFSYDNKNNSYSLIAQAPRNITQNNEQKDPTQELMDQNAKKFALSVDDAFAYLGSINGSRFWSVTKAVKDNEGNVKGVLLMKMSLSENDALVEKTITQVYIFSIIAVVVVLLLVFNHIRLFSYEVRARKLEEIDKMKDDFISMASHELKTPLTAILGYAELLSDTIGKESDETAGTQQKKYLKNINVLIGRLNTLVEDLLDVSRLEQNRLPFDLKPTNIAGLIDDIANEMKIMADQKKLLLENHIATLSNVVVDEERVKQVIVNLVSNAIKYTMQGKVEIQSREDEKFVYVTVADTGLGISGENIKNLFSKFYRVRNSETIAIAGTGLGLWISREIAQKMGGDLSVESIEGVGSHFTLKLKKA